MNFSLKKILLTTFIVLEVSALFAFSAFPRTIVTTDNYSVKLPGPKLSISFEIARRRDCLGFGICNFTAGIEIGRINSCTGNLYVDETSRNLLILEIEKTKGITASAYDKYFKSGIFVMEDDSPIPMEISKQLGISTVKTIIAGNHKVTEKNGILYVALPIN